MSFYNKFLEWFLLPAGDFLLNQQFISQLRKQRKIVKLSAEEIKTIQYDKIKSLLNHASTKSDYYKNLQINSEIDPIKWLKHFPILTKENLRNSQKELITTDQNKLIKQNSSGSSGKQSTIYLSKKELSIHRATQTLWWEWAGYKIGNPILQTGLSPTRSVVKLIKDFFFRTNYIFAFSFTPEKAVESLKWNEHKKNRVLAGYASSLYVLSQHAKESKLSVNFTTAISWGDKLFDTYKKSISETFNCPVFETYGTTEGMMIAAQYDLPYMYIMSTNVFLELVDDSGKEVGDGEIGHVVVTNLNGFAMPLIRYKIGDLAIKLPASEYPVNRKIKLPLLQKVIGRDTDLVKTHSGRFMIVHSFTGIFEHIPEIKQFRVIQENLDGIMIEYIPANNFKKECIDTAQSQIMEYIQEPFQIHFQAVDYIPNSPSGKPQIIVSKINKKT